MSIATVRQSIYDKTTEELRYLIGLAVFCIFGLLIVYTYFVSLTVIDSVKYRRLVAEVSDLNTELGFLESQYSTLAQSLTLEQAHLLGFLDSKNPQFAQMGGMQKLSFVAQQ